MPQIIIEPDGTRRVVDDGRLPMRPYFDQLFAEAPIEALVAPSPPPVAAVPVAPPPQAVLQASPPERRPSVFQRIWGAISDLNRPRAIVGDTATPQAAGYELNEAAGLPVPPAPPSPAPVAPQEAPQTAPQPASVATPQPTPQPAPQPSQAASPPAQEAPQTPPQPSAPIAQALNPQDPYADHRRVIQGFEGNGVNPRSGAAGFGQVLPSTYADWVVRYRHLYPWMPATFEEWKNAPRELQERVYNEVIFPNEYEPALRRAGLEFTPLNVAVTNFLGPSGGPRFLLGARQNPNAPSTSLVSPEAAEANRNVFFTPEGRERTAAEVLHLIGSGWGRQGGALTGVNGSSSPAPASGGGGPASSPDANPYRDRMMQLLQRIEAERGQRPDFGEIMFRMGTGILSGRNLAEGLGRGGQLAAELMSEQRRLNAQRDQTLISGYGSLARDRSAREIYNAPRNVRIFPNDGSPAFDVIGRVINGQTYVRHPQTGQEVPIHEAYPNANARFTSISDGLAFEHQAGGIPGAERVLTVGNEQVPIFSFSREGQEKAYGFGLNAITAHRRMMELEQTPGFDPTSVTAAISQYLVDTGPIDPRRLATLFTNPQEQAYALAVLQFINSLARRESGAEIRATEWSRYSALIAPRAGDSPEAVRERAQIRSNNIIALIGQAGPAGPYLAEILSGKRNLPSAYANPSVVDSTFINRGQQQNQTQQPQQQGGEGPRRLTTLNAQIINGLRDDEEVQVQIRGQWVTVTGRDLKAELARRLGGQRQN